MNKSCPFCGNTVFFSYKMSKYYIYQCSYCGTGMCSPFPSKYETKSFYRGFIPHLNRTKILKSLKNANDFFVHMGLYPDKKQLSFLDIGGGAGLFSYAFEHYGYGNSTYTDIDQMSCRFVKNELGISEVINCDANTIGDYINHKYDVIYSRHLLEHLHDPIGFIDKTMKLLEPGGICIHQFPNGSSYEYLPYGKMIHYRLKKIHRSSKFSTLALTKKILSGQMMHGIDPPRHLWALTPKGIKFFADKNRYQCKLFTAHLGELPFSPNYASPVSIIERVCHFFGQQFFSRIAGGTHLIAVFTGQHHE